MNKDNQSLTDFWSKENIYLRKKGFFYYASRMMFERNLYHISGKRVLDVGCGQGMMMEYLTRMGNKVDGFDIAYPSVHHNAKRGLPVLKADTRFIPFKNDTFDLVYSLGVIEHFPGTMRALKEQVRVCKPGGIVIAVVPNVMTPFFPASIFFDFLTKWGHKLRVTYGKAFSKNKLMKMFLDAGCEDIRINPYYGSAFLQVLTKEMHPKLLDFFENSFLSKHFGLVLWAMGNKRNKS